MGLGLGAREGGGMVDRPPFVTKWLNSTMCVEDVTKCEFQASEFMSTQGVEHDSTTPIETNRAEMGGDDPRPPLPRRKSEEAEGQAIKWEEEPPCGVTVFPWEGEQPPDSFVQVDQQLMGSSVFSVQDDQPLLETNCKVQVDQHFYTPSPPNLRVDQHCSGMEHDVRVDQHFSRIKCNLQGDQPLLEANCGVQDNQHFSIASRTNLQVDQHCSGAKCHLQDDQQFSLPSQCGLQGGQPPMVSLSPENRGWNPPCPENHDAGEKLAADFHQDVQNLQIQCEGRGVQNAETWTCPYCVGTWAPHGIYREKGYVGTPPITPDWSGARCLLCGGIRFFDPEGKE